MVYMLSKILQLTVGSHDLFHAEKKLNVVASWATHKMITIFTQNDYFHHFEWNRYHFVDLLSLWQHLSSSQLEIGHMINGTTHEIQHRKWGLSYNGKLRLDPKIIPVSSFALPSISTTPCYRNSLISNLTLIILSIIVLLEQTSSS